MNNENNNTAVQEEKVTIADPNVNVSNVQTEVKEEKMITEKNFNCISYVNSYCCVPNYCIICMVY